MKSSKFDRNYKAIIFDVDGTLVPIIKDALPSENVRKAIEKASKKVKISIATSRPNPLAKDIINHLSLSAPCILAGGGNIYDPIIDRMIDEVLLDLKTYKEILKADKKVKSIGFIYDSSEKDYKVSEYSFNKPMHYWNGNLDESEADSLFEDLSKIPTISVHKLTSWTPGKVDIMAAPLEATKQHGILKVAEILGIETSDIIGVGDGYNDFPLLMACGLKIAMGNAVEDLKAIADYIAPPVEEDGVVDVIEKFILKTL